MATDTIEHTDRLGRLGAGFAVAVPVAIFLVLAGYLHGRISGTPGVAYPWIVLGAFAVLGAAALAVVSLPAAVLAMALVVILLLAVSLVIIYRRAP